MTASVPSRIALATSATSARVGRVEATIESSICVAVIDGRASRPAQASSSFWTIGTRSIGSSMPRSPRATMTQSAARMISSARSTACGFSIFAMSGRRVCSRTNAMSSGERTNDSATMSTPIFSPTARCARSSSGTAGQLVERAGDVQALARGDRAADLDLGLDLERRRAHVRARAAGRCRRRGT